MTDLVLRDDRVRGMPTYLGWDPFRIMDQLLRWEPFEGWRGLRAGAGFVPPAEVHEDDERYLVTLDVPGVTEQDLEITVRGADLVVSGRRDAERQRGDGAYYAFERHYGAFTRTFRLPDGIDADHIDAHLQHGVLQVRLPKRPEARPRKIAVTVLGPGRGE